jgi:hypothetical protein
VFFNPFQDPLHVSQIAFPNPHPPPTFTLIRAVKTKKTPAQIETGLCRLQDAGINLKRTQ